MQFIGLLGQLSMCNFLDCWDSFQYAIYWIVGAALNVQFIGLLGQLSMCNLLDCWGGSECVWMF
jgi:hypothetical protein